MNDHTITSIVSVLLAITGLAILATLVSGKANTSNVLGSFGGAISKMICVALSPVTGGNCGSSGVTISTGTTNASNSNVSGYGNSNPNNPNCIGGYDITNGNRC